MNNSTNNQNGKNKPVTREELDLLIKDAQRSNDWSKVENANVYEITDMSYLFYKIKDIQDLDLSSWDTSKVTDMALMFSCSDFNSPLSFDTSNVKNMVGMFATCEYNHPLEFNTSNVTNMSYMFSNSKYNHPLQFDTSSVINMEAMFLRSQYNHILNFNTSNIITMNSLFCNSKFNFPLNFDTSNVKDMRHIFKNSSFNQDISDWVIQDNESNKEAIEYRDECIVKRIEREAIEVSIKNNKSKHHLSHGLKL